MKSRKSIDEIREAFLKAFYENKELREIKEKLDSIKAKSFMPLFVYDNKGYSVTQFSNN
jgi:hypothetical protein